MAEHGTSESTPDLDRYRIEKSRIALCLTRNTLRTLDISDIRGIHGGMIDPSRRSGCGEDCPPPPPRSGHCITD